MPADGYTALFERLLDHPLIEVRTGVEFADVREPYDHLVWTGPIDEYYGRRFGALPVPRAALRDRDARDAGRRAACSRSRSSTTRPRTSPYTRVTEYRHLTGQDHGASTLHYEYPSAEGDPYYPVPRPENRALYQRYAALAATRDGRHLRRPARPLPVPEHGSGRRAGALSVRGYLRPRTLACMPEPFVSALMAAYNAEPFVAEAIESALAQDWPADRLEVVVVDDGSTDGTAAVVSSYVERLPGRVRLIRQANGGPCAAVNTALAAARGEWLGLLDADDAWPADKLRVQGEVLRCAACGRAGLRRHARDRRARRRDPGVLAGGRAGDPRGPLRRRAARGQRRDRVLAADARVGRRADPGRDPLHRLVVRGARRARLRASPTSPSRARSTASTAATSRSASGPDPRARAAQGADASCAGSCAGCEPGMATARGLATAWTYFEHCERELAALGEAGAEVSDADRAEARRELAGAGVRRPRGAAGRARRAPGRRLAAGSVGRAGRRAAARALVRAA